VNKRLVLGIAAVSLITLSAMPTEAAVIGTLDESTATTFAQTSMPRPTNSDDATYFVFTDRYANGSEDNDYGSGPNQQGFDTTSVAAYHGGDFIGLKENLDRIARLGFNSIWITPPVVNDYKGYHGYWGLDFTTVDPHLGTEAEFQEFVDYAHELGLKVIMDIVLNHTADVIAYSDTGNGFMPLGANPYKDAAGNTFNIGEKSKFTTTCTSIGEANCFPILDSQISMPRDPYIPSESKNAKRHPDFLQDITSYHNRGEASGCGWAPGSCAMMGDFYGLDDLMTENPTVVQGLSDVYASWVTEFGIDGFRIDTAKHVNKEFFDSWIPAIDAAGQAAGKGDHLTVFGEAWLPSASELSSMMRKYQMESLIDFPMQAIVPKFAAGNKTGLNMKTGFSYDDYFNTGNQSDIIRNAYGLTTFLGNHDMGRGNSFVAGATSEEGAKLTARVKLANSILFLMRGAPVVYYGEEVGLLSSGTNEYSRQDMMKTDVSAWRKMHRIGADPIKTGSLLTPAEEQHPLSVHIRALQAFRSEHPGFVQGAAITRYADTNVIAWSRIDATDNHEFLVVANNSKTIRTVTIPVSTKSSAFVGVFGSTATFNSSGKTTIKVTVPARKAIVLRAANTLTIPEVLPVLTLKVKTDYTAQAPMLLASTTAKTPLVVTFLARASESDEWEVIGVDDSPTYRFALDPWVWGDNASMQFAVIARTYDGRVAGGQIVSANYADVAP
jgi:glycosidase